MNDILLIGLPRSGTTLACHLLNKCSDTVALHEPWPVNRLAIPNSAVGRVGMIRNIFAQTRGILLREGRAITKHIEGRIPDNHFGIDRTEGRLRTDTHLNHGMIEIDKALSKHFNLIVKHPAAFTALLPELVGAFPIYAIIRNPLSILASWNSCDMHVNRGHLPIGELLDHSLEVALGSKDSRLERQLYILEWFFSNFVRHLPADCIIRYEDLIASHGKVLKRICPQAVGLDETLENKNSNVLYDWDNMQLLADKLNKLDSVIWDIYPRSSIGIVLDSIRR